MKHQYILAIDPSGNFYEGKGTTGWCVFNCGTEEIIEAGHIEAVHYESQIEYWNDIVELVIDKHKKHGKRLAVVIEDYLLYAHKAQNQVNSRMETPKLIGILEFICTINDIHYILQPASEVKNRWTLEILYHKGYVGLNKRKHIVPKTKQVLNKHSIDSVRHAIHYFKFKNN